MSELLFDGSLWCNLDVALRKMNSVYQQEFETIGLLIIEACVLRLLYKEDGQMASRLAHGVGRPATSFTPILDAIEEKGLIERRAHPADRRALKIYLTAKGKSLEGQVAAITERIEKKLRQQFSTKDWNGFEGVLADLQSMPS